METRPKLLLGVALLLVASGVTAFLVAEHKAAPKHLLTVTPDVLYRSGLLRPENLEGVMDRFGIRTVVNLLPAESLSPERLERLWAEERIAGERGLRMVSIPMPAETPPTPAQLEEWLALFDDEQNLPILVHCEYGVIRTGMMVAAYEIEKLGHTGEQALADLPRFGHDINEPRRKPMRDFVLGYKPGAASRSAAK